MRICCAFCHSRLSVSPLSPESVIILAAFGVQLQTMFRSWENSSPLCSNQQDFETCTYGMRHTILLSLEFVSDHTWRGRTFTSVRGIISSRQNVSFHLEGSVCCHC